LTDHLELANRGVLPHALGEEGVSTGARIDCNVVKRVADMLQVDAVLRPQSVQRQVTSRQCQRRNVAGVTTNLSRP
jgi:hypothetical protein